MKTDHLPFVVETTFDQAVHYLDSRSKVSLIIANNKIIQGIQRTPVDEVTKARHAQFFTPADVALYSAIELYRCQKFPLPVMDPCSGLGSLIIASGFILAEQFGLRGNELLKYIHGNEIDPETRQESINNIVTSLQDYLSPEITLEEATNRLNENISLGEANSQSSKMLSNHAIIVNPPYKEEASSNVWIPIVQKILEAKSKTFTFILPVAISSSVRTAHLRKTMKEDYNIKAFHHEIRPRPLFKNVDQRISIITGTLNGKRDRIYETTGFLTHRAGDRSSIWMASSTFVLWNPSHPAYFQRFILKMKISMKTVFT